MRKRETSHTIAMFSLTFLEAWEGGVSVSVISQGAHCHKSLLKIRISMGINRKIPETLKIHVNCHLIYIPQKDVKKKIIFSKF